MASLVYANDPIPPPPDDLPQIEEGATVRERQKIFSVPDLSGPMQVNTKVPESQVDKLSRNMKARSASTRSRVRHLTAR